MADPRTRKRELTAMGEAMNEIEPESAYIVTRREEERVSTDAGTVEVVPAWRFLLNLSHGKDA